MNALGHHAIVEMLDEIAYLDGCRPQAAYCVLKTDDDGVEASDGRLYCRRCCWDVRGRPLVSTLECEDEPCHCDNCGCLLAYTLSGEAARRLADEFIDRSTRMHCDDHYHVARMVEASPCGNVLKAAVRAIEGFDGV